MFLAACVEDNHLPEGLADARFAGGPQIMWDLEARPFPEIPFPNDVATVIDETSPTGRRVNVSVQGASDAESAVREKVNEMTGFGVISPMWVRFDAPLDLQNLLDRHAERVPDFGDDAVYLVNVDRDSENFGELVLLDIGRGNYPILHSRPDGFFDNDPREAGTNLVFESYEEVDENGNGKLDPMEDTDDDGVWDRPNVLRPSVDPYAPGNTLEFYERETNTLIVRTVKPLDPGTTYAMVLTSALVGENNVPIDSPFDTINHTRQTEALTPLKELLPERFPERFDYRLRNVRFAWTFSTQDPTAELRAVRSGLYGEGVLSWLKEKYPARLEMVHNGKKEGASEPMTFDLGPLLDFLVPLLTNAFGIDEAAAGALEESYDDIDYIVSGSYVSPYFLADDDGHATKDPVKLAGLQGNPADDDETFDIDLHTGEARVGEDEVTFMCTVPTTIPGVREPPFNTIIYSHAISSTRLEVVLIFGGSMAKLGFAMCAIDAVGHGVAIPAQFQGLVTRFSEFLDVPNFAGIVDHHRARDLNNDGLPESGGKYFTADILHSRDNMRQTAIDQMQLVRILRSWDGERRWPDDVDDSSPYLKARPHMVAGWDQDGDGKGEIAGDFNADGVVDFGGDVTFGGFGTSLGGIQSTILAAIEPTIRNVASNAGGGILGEIAIRTTISNVRNGVQLRMFGPMFLGDPVMEDDEWTGEMDLRMILASADEDVEIPLGRISGIENGDRIVLRNPVREANDAVPEHDKKSMVHVRDGRFRIGISADAAGATARRALLGFDPRLNLVEEIMGCKEVSRCGEEPVNMCPGNHTCAPDGTCMPIQQCIWDFEPSMAEGRVLESSEFFPEGLNTLQLQAELARRTVSTDTKLGSTDLGDPLKIEIYAPDGTLKQVIDTFPENVAFQNMFYPAGTPLAALAQGWGLRRQTPRMRKFLAVSQMLLEAADPAVWATHYFENPLSFPYEDERFQTGNTNLLMIGTVGDQTVPISSSIAIARAAGVLDLENKQVDYEKTENQFLVDTFVYEGVPWFDRFPDHPNTLFDADDLDEGAFRSPNAPEDPDPNMDAETPLRATIQTNGDGLSGLRLPYLATDGEHTFNAPNPSAAFDVPSFMHNQVGWYLLTSGQEIKNDRCLEELSMKDCDFFDKETFVPPRLK
jgi:hypothetical protein